MKPATDEVLTLANGRRVGVLARGPKNGHPVVHVHGWPGSRFEQLAIPDDALTRQDVRLIAVDRPGYGQSEPLAGTRAERMADVLGVCDALGIERFAAVGVSCGGSNVVALAASAPSRVTQIVLSSAQMPYDDDSALKQLEPEQFDELDTFRRGRTPDFEVAEANYRQRLLDKGASELLDSDSFSEAERQWLAQQWVRDALEADVREAVQGGSEGLLEDALMCVKPFEFEMDAVKCPVYAVHGTSDDWEPLDNLRRFLVQIPTSQLITLEGMSHMGPLLYPDLLLSLARQTH